MAGVLVNVLGFVHPHVQSLVREGLWGFPDKKLNRQRWRNIEVGMNALFYGDFRGKKGIWLRGQVAEVFERRERVEYWVQDPTGYPLQIKVKLEHPVSLDEAQCISKEELASVFNLGVARQKYDRWSLVVFGDTSKRGVTYSAATFKKMYDEFEARNLVEVKLEEPTHDEIKEIIYQIGVVQGKFPSKEHRMDGRRVDVVWRRTEVSVPTWAFEVQLSGNMVEALAKLKHAWDLYNSIPILVTTQDQFGQVEELLGGSFHEIREAIRVVTWQRIKKMYELKIELRDLRNELRIP